MPTPVLRWGLLSTARINRSLIPAIRASEVHELVAVASRDPERAASYAREWDIPRVLPSYEALIEDPAIDIVYNPLPNSLHAEWTVRAAQRGKHVLCEKPIGLTTGEVRAIAAAARDAKVVVAEAFMYRHHPQTRQVVEIVRSGALGRVRMVRGAFTFYLDRPGDVRFVRALGGGSLWDVGCYPVSYARLVAGAEPIEAWGAAVEEGEVDVAFSGGLRFPGDLIAQFDCGFRATFRQQIEIVGEEGTLTVPRPYKPAAANPEPLVLVRGDRVDTIEPELDDLYAGEVRDIGRVITTGSAPAMTLADSLGNTAALVALLEAAGSGRTVPVPREELE